MKKDDVIRWQYIVNAVGDANCICIHKDKTMSRTIERPYLNRYYREPQRRTFLIDFGYSSKAFFTNDLKQCAIESDEFLLTHYHLDHYKGLEKIDDKQLLVERLYYPYIPEVIEEPDLQNKISNIMHFMIAIDSKLNGMALSLITLLKRKNDFDDFEYEPVYQDMSIFDGNYEVIWPPKKLFSKDTTTKSLKTGIEKIENILNKDNNSEIYKLWDSFNREVKLHKDDNIQIFKNRVDEICFAIIKNFNIDLTKYQITLDSLRKAIRKVTNRFSVCLFKKNEFLFLGDLEKPEIKACLKYLFNRFQGTIKVKYLITPHHGSNNHYRSDIGNYVEADYVISSNGERGFEKYQEKYNDLAKLDSYCTNDGTFDSNTLKTDTQ